LAGGRLWRVCACACAMRGAANDRLPYHITTPNDPQCP
jgi:hypothetical protein